MKPLRSHIIILFFILVSVNISGQNYIGMHRDSIQKTVRKDFPDFRADNTTSNNTYNYLKLVDRVNEQTALFFLSSDNRCTRVRWMSDYSNLGDIRSMLDKKYRKAGENKWVHNTGGKEFRITLDEEEWYFTINFFED